MDSVLTSLYVVLSVVFVLILISLLILSLCVRALIRSERIRKEMECELALLLPPKTGALYQVEQPGHILDTQPSAPNFFPQNQRERGDWIGSHLPNHVLDEGDHPLLSSPTPPPPYHSHAACD